MIATTTLPLAPLLPDDASGCADCGERLRGYLAASPHVVAADLSATDDWLVVRYRDDQTDAPTLAAQAAAQAGAITRRYLHRRLPITGLHCADCARALGEGVAALPGVERAVVAFAAGSLAVEFDSERVGLEAVVGRVRAMGYGVGAAGATCTVFRVEGMDCADCARTLERVVSAQPGVTSAAVEFAAGRLRVEHDPLAAPTAALLRRVAEAGFSAAPVGEPPVAPARWDWLRGRPGATLAAAAGLALGVAAGLAGWPEPVAIAAYAAAIAVGGWRVARAGWVALRRARALDMNALMTIAVLGACLIGEWAEGATIVVLFAVGATLEQWTLERARRSIAGLMRLAPTTATVLRDGRPTVAPAAAVAVGETLLVRPGERLPLDGTVIEGESAVDQAPITGESTPAEVGPGAAVYAGTVNGDGPLTVRVTAAAGDTTLARIVRLVDAAQAQRAPVERFVDRFARWYTPAVLVGAALVAVVPPLLLAAPAGEWFYRALVLLVIACPCALVISTPVAIVTALGSAARRGILIKGGAHLETLGRLRTIAFDKTGTLTRGRPALTALEPLADADPDAALALAAALEARSEHPIAAAVTAAARARDLSLPAVNGHRTRRGLGVEGAVGGVGYRLGSPRLFDGHPALGPAIEARLAALADAGQTALLLGDEARLLAILAVADAPRPAAAAAVAALRRLGLSVAMLTGDNARVAAAIAARVGVPTVRAGLLPEEKTAAVADLAASAGPVAMVGDGINDTPALARADVGIAMGAGGTAAALETADVALMADDLSRLPTAIRLGRRALAIIGQNIAAALLIKVVFVTLALTGASSLWLAVLADLGGSLLVTLNALRLLRDDEPHTGHDHGG